MSLISLVSNLVSTVYPVIASYKAFDSYSKVANKIALNHYKIGGVTVPLHLVFKSQSEETPADDEKALQTHLITIQKWFIYWVVSATVQTAESVLFFRQIIPLYSLFKLGLSLWLISPMLSLTGPDTDTSRAFDNTEDWTQFSQSGCGLVYFSFIKPWIDTKFKNVSFNPQSLLLEAKGLLSVFGSPNEGNIKAFTERGEREVEGLAAETGILDSSYVLVKDITSKFGIANEPIRENEHNELPHESHETHHHLHEGNETHLHHRNTPEKKKGWLW